MKDDMYEFFFLTSISFQAQHFNPEFSKLCIRDSITNPHWENADGNALTKALVGDEVTLCADVQDIPDGTGAKIKIVEKDADSEQEKEEKGYTLPEYAFTVECGSTTTVKIPIPGKSPRRRMHLCLSGTCKTKVIVWRLLKTSRRRK